MNLHRLPLLGVLLLALAGCTYYIGPHLAEVGDELYLLLNAANVAEGSGEKAGESCFVYRAVPAADGTVRWEHPRTPRPIARLNGMPVAVCAVGDRLWACFPSLVNGYRLGGPSTPSPKPSPAPGAGPAPDDSDITQTFPRDWKIAAAAAWERDGEPCLLVSGRGADGRLRAAYRRPDGEWGDLPPGPELGALQAERALRLVLAVSREPTPARRGDARAPRCWFVWVRPEARSGATGPVSLRWALFADGGWQTGLPELPEPSPDPLARRPAVLESLALTTAGPGLLLALQTRGSLIGDRARLLAARYDGRRWGGLAPVETPPRAPPLGPRLALLERADGELVLARTTMDGVELFRAPAPGDAAPRWTALGRPAGVARVWGVRALAGSFLLPAGLLALGVLLLVRRRRRLIRLLRLAPIAEPGSVLRRGGAFLIDLGLLYLPPALGVFWLAYGRLRLDLDGALKLATLAGHLAYAALGTLLELRWGRTPGKRLLGLRVTGLDGDEPEWYRVLLRNLLRLVDGWLVPLPLTLSAALPVPLLGLIFLLGTLRRQRFGDLIAQTVVVRERRTALPAEAGGDAAS